MAAAATLSRQPGGAAASYGATCRFAGTSTADVLGHVHLRSDGPAASAHIWRLRTRDERLCCSEMKQTLLARRDYGEQVLPDASELRRMRAHRISMPLRTILS